MPKLFHNDIDDLEPTAFNTEIKEGRCPSCKSSTDEILSGEYKNKSHDEHQLFVIQRNGMKNCRCSHRFDLIICTCFECDGHFPSNKVMKQLIDYLDTEKLKEEST